MLYIYMDKIYVRPFDNRLVEVKISKKGDEYNVEATEKTVEINNDVRSQMFSIALEEAYKVQNKSGKEKTSKDFILD